MSTVDPTRITKRLSYPFRWIQSLTKGVAKNATLEELKSQLVAALYEVAKQDKTFRIMVLVDDIDRLEPQEILAVLRLIKAVADFPAITYVLAYGRDAVAQAVAKSTCVLDGDAYLEKII